MNFESVQEKSREPIASQKKEMVRSFQADISRQTCLACGSIVPSGASRCQVCGNGLSMEANASVSLKDTLLSFAVLLLVALNIAPVWSSDQIYGKAILFLRKLGIILPKSLGEAQQYRSLISNVVNIYQTLNLVYYITIALIGFLLIFGWLREKQGYKGFPNKVWFILGVTLLLFPIANLVVSWNMFFTPGVVGTTIAALIVLFAGIISRQS